MILAEENRALGSVTARVEVITARVVVLTVLASVLVWTPVHSRNDVMQWLRYNMRIYVAVLFKIYIM